MWLGSPLRCRPLSKRGEDVPLLWSLGGPGDPGTEQRRVRWADAPGGPRGHDTRPPEERAPRHGRATSAGPSLVCCHLPTSP